MGLARRIRLAGLADLTGLVEVELALGVETHSQAIEDTAVAATKSRLCSGCGTTWQSSFLVASSS